MMTFAWVEPFSYQGTVAAASRSKLDFQKHMGWRRRLCGFLFWVERELKDNSNTTIMIAMQD